ncbi:MAG: MFS transporter [Candidatus Hodarchaeales archaeon]|jgi:GPH family glycoside/pentoside/hexuronide:cation symporter
MNISEYTPARFQRFAWSFGSFGNAIMSNVLSIFVIIFYLEEVLVNPNNWDALFVTIITFSGKFSEGLMNVPIARLSDNIRTRFGRRRPFLLLSPLWIFFFVLIFSCPTTETFIALIWLLISFMGFRWTNAAVINPYLALLPEIAPSTQERTSYQAGRTIFTLIGTILGVLIFPILRSIFAGIFGEGRMTAFFSTLPIAFFALFCMILVFFGVKENEKATLTHLGLIESFKLTFKNESFFPSYLATVSTQMLAEAMLLAAIPMIAINYLGLNPEVSLDSLIVSLISGFFVISAILSVPIMSKLSYKYGKARVYYYCCLFFGILPWMMFFLGQIPFITPENVISFVNFVTEDGTRLQLVTSPDWMNFVLLQTLLTIIIVGIPVGGVMVLGYSVFSDVIDYDEKVTGQRRESMYFAAQGVVDWFFAASGDLILGIILTLFGREFFLSGVETEAGLLNTGPLGLLLVGPVAGTFLILGALLFRKYPLMEGRKEEE